MHIYLTKRVLSCIFALFVISIITFFLMHALPGETAEMVLKQSVSGLEGYISPEDVKGISQRYNLDSPLIDQYGNWLYNATVKQDFGESYGFKKPVFDIILLRLPATLELATVSIIVVSVLGILIGMYAAFREGTFIDRIIRIITMFEVSFPSFWIALLFIIIFSLTLKLTPTMGYGGIQYLILPVAALSCHPLAVIIRVTRTSTLEVLSQPCIRFAVAKGLSWATIIRRHVLKNALLPVITILGVQFGQMLSGTMIIESIYAWPGLGSLLIEATYARDIPLVIGAIITVVTLVLLVNLFVDLLCTWIDPRIRYE